MVDVKDKEDKKDESEEKKEEILAEQTLDQVHQNVVNDLENEEDKEGEEDDSTEDDKGSKEEDAPADKPDESVIPESKPEPEKKEAPEPAPELDTDTTKNGPGKVAVKDVDGVTHYFNDLDEMPEDFEPVTYKELARAVSKLTDKARDDREAKMAEEKKKAEDEQTARIKAIKDAWEADISSLTEAKSIPAEGDERQATIDGVYSVMNEKLAKGKVIDFETGFEIWSSRQGGEEKKKLIDKKNEDKKKRGGMIAGAGTGATASAKSRVIEGPPVGVTLDDVHESVLGSL